MEQAVLKPQAYIMAVSSDLDLRAKLVNIAGHSLMRFRHHLTHEQAGQQLTAELPLLIIIDLRLSHDHDNIYLQKIMATAQSWHVPLLFLSSHDDHLSWIKKRSCHCYMLHQQFTEQALADRLVTALHYRFTFERPLALCIDDASAWEQNRILFLCQAGFRVFLASAEKACAVEFVPDLILINRELPQLGGLLAQKALSQKYQQHPIPLITYKASELAGQPDLSIDIMSPQYHGILAPIKDMPVLAARMRQTKMMEGIFAAKNLNRMATNWEEITEYCRNLVQNNLRQQTKSVLYRVKLFDYHKTLALFGHATTELLHQTTTSVILNEIRQSDFVASVQRGEFFLLLENKTSAETDPIFERIQTEISQTFFVRDAIQNQTFPTFAFMRLLLPDEMSNPVELLNYLKNPWPS